MNRKFSWMLMLLCIHIGVVNSESDSPIVVLNGDKVKLSVSQATGARVSSFSWRGYELLVEEDPDDLTFNNWGSTFWLSPQSLWGWPPVENHDSKPYSLLDRTKTSAKLLSNSERGASIEKTFSLIGENFNVVRLDYKVIAHKEFPELAAWEVTRVPKNGLVFFPAAGSIKTTMGKVEYTLDSGGYVWVDLSTLKSEGKLIANGRAGWLAWYDRGRIFLKTYAPVEKSRMASGEGDVEIYINPDRSYAELEVQSAASKLIAGNSLSWTVHWLVLDVPDAMKLNAKPADLLELALKAVE